MAGKSAAGEKRRCRMPKAMTVRERMDRKLHTKRGRALYQ
jgi:hypothetical protein